MTGDEKLMLSALTVITELQGRVEGCEIEYPAMMTNYTVARLTRRLANGADYEREAKSGNADA